MQWISKVEIYNISINKTNSGDLCVSLYFSKYEGI